MQTVRRRDFLKTALAASAAGVAPFSILRSGAAPNSKLNIVGVGIGGMGTNNLAMLVRKHNIIGIADPDEAWSGAKTKRHAQLNGVKRWRDYRVMFDKIGKEIDGVCTATPEHARFAVCMYFMARGKHVFAQKPLCHTVDEARILHKASKKYKVVTQMGNQGHSTESTALIRDWIEAGSIGHVKEVIGYSTKNYWTKDAVVGGCAIPDTLDWDVWLNRAEEIPYSTSYMNREWIRFSHFSGVVGDMASHTLDPANYALRLGAPTSVHAELLEPAAKGALPKAGVVTWEFPARDKLPPVTMKYYVGPGLEKPRPKHVEKGRNISGFQNAGAVFVGESASIIHGSHSQSPRIYPETAMKATPKPPRVSYRSKARGHENNWTEAILGNDKAMSHFDYACPFSETIILGDIALMHPGKKLLWDAEKMVITNDEAANKSIFMRRLAPRDDMGWM